MAEPDDTFRDHADADPEHDPSPNPFDTASGYSGEDYALAREREEGERHPSGHPLAGDASRVELPADDALGRDIPPEAGRRAWFDPKTGAVHGSGSGAGGGNDGEDYDAGTPGGA